MLLETVNIEKQFANHKALNRVNVSVPKGSIYGLLGPNGAGKTTLIRIINQITAPDKGKVLFDKHKLNSAHIKKIGYLPEERGLYRKMKVGEQVIYLARLKGLSTAEAKKRTLAWLKKFEITDWWNRKVEELSKGMQQKIQFIVTVIHEPELLIFDEPFSGFDPINVNLLKNEILALRDNGATIIFSTHNMESVEQLCDHIALINKSNLVLKGEVSEVKNSYKSNIFEVAFEGAYNSFGAALSSGYEMLETTKKDDIYTTRFKLLNGTTTNDLLSKLLPTGKIIGFKEVIPTMNDIFIRVVQQNRQNNE